ncbi:MAG: divalent-cation tolerance protein CutA [Candidatus Obscuribacterales bacterium]|nr:divalent-cation tolerance protein CutA [Candidatus Obscuribacterales bacterium]
MSEEVVVFVTCPAMASQHFAEQLIESNVAACVNILPAIKSVYRWENKLTVDDGEALLIIKSSLAVWSDLESKIRAIHSYEVPEIICVPIVKGHEPYLNWLNQSVLIQAQGERQQT